MRRALWQTGPSTTSVLYSSYPLVEHSDVSPKPTNNIRKMEKIKFGYSMKNIAICNRRQYMCKLYEMTSRMIERIRWKVYHFEKYTDDQDDNNEGLHRVFPTRNSAPANDNLVDFESDIYNLIRSVEFRRQSNDFLDKLNKDTKSIKESHKVFIFADKSSNIYKMEAEQYTKLLDRSITADYRKIGKETIDEINHEASEIISKHTNLRKRKIPKLEVKPAFVTIKDHKADFPRSVKCRLINPTKTHLAKMSKAILDKINNEIRNRTKLKQWKNTGEVLDWYKKMSNKCNKIFIKFDIVNFYPSITESILLKALAFAKKFTNINTEESEIILHSCKTVLYHGGSTWTKKGNKDLFDIPMGSFHGAEACELIGLFLLDKLSNKLDTDCYGIYRDDGLVIIDDMTNTQLDRLRKDFHKIFKTHGFSITIEMGMKKTEFLDVVMDLQNEAYEPYRKPNSEILYIHSKSNHPAYIKKELPNMISKRISSLSTNEEVFNSAILQYQLSIQNNAYKEELKYEPNNTCTTRKRQRKRNILYYHPPFCSSVKTNIGKEFLKLVNKHFGKNNKYHKILNRNNIKISYSCMGNMKSIITAHNRKLLSEKNEPQSEKQKKNCNCQKRRICPLDGECLTENVIYKATVTSEVEEKEYVGSTGNNFKTRYNQHKASFKNKKTKTTELAKYIGELEDKRIKFDIKWRIMHKIKINSTTGANGCTLCNLERFELARTCKQKSLNKRNEIQARCPHSKSNYF